MTSHSGAFCSSRLKARQFLRFRRDAVSYTHLDVYKRQEEVLAEGKVERVGTDTAIFHFSKPDGFRIFQENLSIPTYTEGIQLFLDRILDKENGVLGNLSELARVGFKTVLSRDHYGIHELTPEAVSYTHLDVYKRQTIPYMTNQHRGIDL